VQDKTRAKMENITATKGDLQQTILPKRAKEELQKSFV
jgi:hypothetical protein